MSEAKQMSARSVPQGSTTISLNLGGNANGVAMPTASNSTLLNGGLTTTFLSPTKPDMVKMSQSMKTSQTQKSQFKSVQMISQPSNLTGASGTSCVVLQQVGSGSSSHNLAFSSVVDNNQTQGSPMYQSSNLAFLSPTRTVQNSNALSNQSSDSNHVQMQTAQISTQYTHIDGRQVQMIRLNNNQYYQVGQGGQSIAIQQYVQQSQQQFVALNGSVVFANQANQDANRILQALPTQVHIQNTVSPQNTSFQLTKAALKNIKSVNQALSSNKKSDPQQPLQAVATSSSQYLTPTLPSASSTAYEKSPGSAVQVFPSQSVKSKNWSRSTKSKNKVLPHQAQVVTQTQHVTNNHGQPTATIQQIALPPNSQNRGEVPIISNQVSSSDTLKTSNHQAESTESQGLSQQHGITVTTSQHHGSTVATSHPQEFSGTLSQQRRPSTTTSQQPASSVLTSQQQESLPSLLQHGSETSALQHGSVPSTEQHGALLTTSQQSTSSTAISKQSGNSVMPSQQHVSSTSSLQNKSEHGNNKQQLNPPQAVTGQLPKTSSSQTMLPPPLPTVRPMLPSMTASSSKSVVASVSNNSTIQPQTSQSASTITGKNVQTQMQYIKVEKISGPVNQLSRKILHARKQPPGKQQTVPQLPALQGQHVKLQNGQIIQLKKPLMHLPLKITTKEELEKKVMPPPPVPSQKLSVTSAPPVPPALVSPLPSDLDTEWERALNFAFNSEAPKWSFIQMKSHFRKLIYENECYQGQLREYHQRLLKLERDNNYLMDRLLPYENLSSSDGENSDSSTKTIEERIVVQKLTKKRPVHRPNRSASQKKKGAVSKPVVPSTNGVHAPPNVLPVSQSKSKVTAAVTFSVVPKVVSASSQAVTVSSQTPVSLQPTVVSPAIVVSTSQGQAKNAPNKFSIPRSVSRIPSMVSTGLPLTKSGLSNNPAMKQQMIRAIPNVLKHGQPLLSSLIKSGTSQPQSITITSPLAKASLTIPSSPLAKNSVTIPPPRGPVTMIRNRFSRSELTAGAGSSQRIPPQSALSNKLVFEKPTASTLLRNYISTTSSDASGSSETVFVTPLPKNYNSNANVAAKKSPVKAKVVISELPKTEGVKTLTTYSIRAPVLSGQGYIRAMTPAESKKYMISSARVMTTNPTPLSNATVTYTSLKPTPGSPSKIVVHQQSTSAPKRPSTMPLAVITSITTPSKKANTDNTLRSLPYPPISVQIQPQQTNATSPQHSAAPTHHTVSASTPEGTRALPLTERPPPSSNNGP